MIGKNLGLGLFVVALVVLAMAQDVTVTRAPAAETTQVADENEASAPDAPVQDEDAEETAQDPVAIAVPQVEGMDYVDAIEVLTDAGLEIVVFDGTQHARAVPEFTASSGQAYITATQPEGGARSEDGRVAVAVSWDRSGLPDAARRDPWWWPEHENALGEGTALVCADCHVDSECTSCHVGRANTYAQPGASTPDADTQVALSAREIADVRSAAEAAVKDSASGALLRGLSGGAGSGVLLDLEVADEAPRAAAALVSIVTPVFEAGPTLRVIEVRYFEPGARLPYLTVAVQRTTWADVDWSKVTADLLPDVVDDYTRP